MPSVPVSSPPWVNVSLHTLLHGSKHFFPPHFLIRIHFLIWNDPTTTLTFCLMISLGIRLDYDDVTERWEEATEETVPCFVWTLSHVFFTISTLPCLSHNEFSHTSTFPSQHINPQLKEATWRKIKPVPLWPPRATSGWPFNPLPLLVSPFALVLLHLHFNTVPALS